jgi:hypothetical protein
MYDPWAAEARLHLMKGKFHHRVNADKTIDSICLRCYLTAAKAENEAGLREREEAHECPDKTPFTLEETLRSRRQSSVGSQNGRNSTSSSATQPAVVPSENGTSKPSSPSRSAVTPRLSRATL